MLGCGGRRARSSPSARALWSCSVSWHTILFSAYTVPLLLRSWARYTYA